MALSSYKLEFLSARKPDVMLVLLLVGLCLLLSTLAIFRLQDSNRESLNNLFEESFERISHGVHERVGLYEYGLLGARGSYVSNGSSKYTLQVYRRYAATRNIDREFPGARGFGLIFNVPQEDLSAFTDSMSAEYGEPKSIRNLEKDPDRYFVIRYVEPYDRNVPAVGLNIASEPKRLKAALDSVKTGRATITAPITVVQATDQVAAAFLLMLPIQRQHVQHPMTATSVGELDQTIGWSYAVLVFSEIVKDIDFKNSQLAVKISDVTGSDTHTFFTAGEWLDEEIEHAGSKRIEVFGRIWQIDAQLMPSATSRAPYNLWLAAILAVLLSCMAVTLTLYILRAKNRAVSERLHELELTQGIIEGSSIGQLLVDERGRIAKINSRVSELFGYPKDELVGELIEKLVPARHATKHTSFRKSYDRQNRNMANGRVVSGLHRLGHEFPIEVTLTWLEVGQEGFVLVSVVDVSERVRFVNKLQASERKWSELANCLPQLTLTMNEEMRVDFLNERWGTSATLNDVRAMEERFYGAVHPEDLQAVRAAVANASISQQPQKLECRLRLHESQPRWYHFELQPIFKGPEVSKWIGSLTDIQERKLAELAVLQMNAELESKVELKTAALQKAERSLTRIMDSVPVMIGYWNENLQEEYANLQLREFRDRIGQEKSQCDGDEMLDESTLFGSNSAYAQAALSGKSSQFDLSVQFERGSLHHYSFHYIPNLVERHVMGFFVLVQDFTELKDLQFKAELASRQKSAFLAVMSHEIRTPLNGVLAFSSLLREKISDPALKDEVDVLYRNAQSMTLILNDILDLSKIESGQFKVESIPFNLMEQLRICNTLQKITAQEKGLKFIELHNGFDEHDTFLGDPTRLRQILQNLLSNSLKFTHKGEIEVSVSYTPQGLDAGKLLLRVRDTGIGMSDDMKKRVFQPFNQADSSTFRKYGGTGLGLSIVHSIVKCMRGQICFESVLNEGTVFNIELPLTRLVRTSGDSTGLLSKEHVPAQSILVVDDVALNRKILGRILQNDGHTVTEVSSAREAIESCQINNYDLVFMDVSMPDMDGYACTQAIRALGGLNAVMPIVALSGHAFDDDIHKAYESGMSMHLSKPLEICKVREVLARFARQATH
ncbi:MAG TPA: CHASE domain-containing protein [Limnobacter sp.]|nr:CHASE domain-containing protein [Limnobacter sp.]